MSAESSRRRQGPRIRKTPAKVEAADSKEAKPSRLKRLTPRVPSNPVSRGVVRGLSFIAPRYFVNAWRELRQVTWPTRRETWRLTGAVFVFAIVFGAAVAVVDKGLDEFFKRVILKQ